MTKALGLSLISGVVLLSASFVPAMAATQFTDEFGPRFTNTVPAALGLSVSDALIATDLDSETARELNKIAPAAGDDMTVAPVQADEKAVHENSGPFSKPAEAVTPAE